MADINIVSVENNIDIGDINIEMSKNNIVLGKNNIGIGDINIVLCKNNIETCDINIEIEASWVMKASYKLVSLLYFLKYRGNQLLLKPSYFWLIVD